MTEGSFLLEHFNTKNYYHKKKLNRRKRNFLTGVLAVGEIQAFGRKLKHIVINLHGTFSLNKKILSGILPGFGSDTILLTSWITLNKKTI